MERIEKCTDTELDEELKRADGMAKLATPAAAYAKAQVLMYISTGTLPENNVLFSDGEKVVSGALVSKSRKSTLMIDEFNRK
jgi:hypothetical protein